MTSSVLTPISVALSPSAVFTTLITVAGWVASARMGKSVGFIMLSDGSSLTPLQVVVGKDLLVAQPDLRRLTTHCAIRVQGSIVPSIGPGQPVELAATAVEIVGMVERPDTYPLQPKEHSPEFIRSHPHLRARLSTGGAIARLRHRASQAIHGFFDERGYAWVATPILTAQDAEGAGARFRVTAEDTDGVEFFGRPTFLTVSGQLAGEAQCLALSKIYTFGPTFRAEKSHTSRHLAEFWMVEPEVAFTSLTDLTTLAQDLLAHVITTCLTRLPAEMALFASQGGPAVATLQQWAEEGVARWTYSAAVSWLQETPSSSYPAIVWGDDLSADHEKALAAHVGRPLCLTDYPKAIKAFYMKASADGQTVESFDLLVPGMGELVGGSVREHDLATMEQRMMEAGMDPESYEAYLDLRRYGSVPHGGFGLGFDRLIAFLSGTPSIRDAIPYPRAPGHLLD